ncbi:MAG: hypothetical protein BWZ00_01684 [Bacteroidetes bacterium ADurb.BinA174]|nr:MAG: hypothetical protein BWZ00_01684 [Bacteroidetes bacterium ADurb.BinA174]
MKNTLLILAFLLSSIVSTDAQSDPKHSDWKFLGNVQYVTQHHWRGIGKGGLFGSAPAFEPSISFVNKNWNMGVFTAASFDNVYKAVIPWVSYSPVKNLWIGVWDIYSAGPAIWTHNPFDYSLCTSKHFVDAVVSYKLPWFPLTLKWATIVAGKDVNPEDKNKPDSEKRRNFTSYGELSYGHSWNDFSVWGCVGMTPFKGLYTSAVGAGKPGINNLELKFQYNFKLYKPVTLPVFAKFTYNPLVEKFLFQAGASLTIPYTFK